MIDAYMHAGRPRFGTGAEAVREMDRWQLAKANIVLPPSQPDFASLEEARKAKGENVRLFGVPFGETESQRAELTSWQINFGISGMRLMPFELKPNTDSLRLLGEAGCWLFAINPHDTPATTQRLLEWLEKYPCGKIAAPHFLKPGCLRDAVEDFTLMRTLLEHPRFFGIFSRHGKTGTTRPFPHDDLRPWVEEVIAICGWEKIMWGSEYPVLYWRDEQIPQAAGWIRRLLPEINEEQNNAFVHGNAQRLFFDPPSPVNQAGAEPAWVEEQRQPGYAVPFAQHGIKLSPRAHAEILHKYLEVNQPGKEISMADFLSGWIEERL